MIGSGCRRREQVHAERIQRGWEWAREERTCQGEDAPALGLHPRRTEDRGFLALRVWQWQVINAGDVHTEFFSRNTGFFSKP
jgi:hypothetical protein